MNERVKRLRESLRVDKFPICSEKAYLIMESYKQNEGLSNILKRAIATAYYLDNKTIFIEKNELIVGNVASRSMGMEAGSLGPTWPEEDLEELLQGNLSIDDEDRVKLRKMDEYWIGKSRTMDERQGQFYDNERLWPFIKKGFLCPPWQRKDQGRGQGAAGVGWGLGIGLSLILPDYEKVIKEGLNKVIKDAEEELKNLKYVDADSVTKGDFLRATIIAFSAIVRLGNRFSSLAREMAAKEEDPVRKKELEEIAQICSWIPGNPARTFREGIQAFWFYWMMVASGTTPGGRFDQFMYPLYKKDKENGNITDNDVLELLECLRIKIMQLNFVGGGKGQREKWAGMARWHNFVIGGVTPDGQDATNELSYLLLEAARDCQTPHPTITVRVHERTPEELMKKSLEVIKTGIGMPAFISDDSYIAFLTGEGVSLEDARDYAIAGCLDVNLPGKSRINAFGMFIIPLVLEITMNNGEDPKTGEILGLKTGELESFQTFEEFFHAFKKQLTHFMGLVNEEHNILLQAQKELFPDVVHSALMHDGIKVGKDALNRRLPFENGSALNMVGMINVADSLAAVKKLVFDDKKVAMGELKKAIDANWEGYEEIHKMCLGAPKYGNGDPYVDLIAKELFQYYADTAHTFHSIYNAKVLPTAISITAHAPGGAITGATPDGRVAGQTFADGSVSPEQGFDRQGPTAVLRSAMNIDQRPYQATLLNMKIHPSTLSTEVDAKKLSDMIKVYFKNGGKHIQFNVTNKAVLLEAQKDKEKHRDLIVRVAGYSAYFVNLTPKVQEEIIARTEHSF
ncbi:glycyl radical protein [Geosporobacter ferrireducens]|uniref:Pyruvate formate-lyase n=1 Tax=Geosporobacter ferrireducens TaxID=1424294 RepID=A0A1D8GFX3_9FIRM|nr:pyruvate formate lyase family protein [Geosporobacter ferrireducens]AOT69806.1 hypothetical protein Gferi_09575 [Geosporobacter ferrireducens]